MRCHLNYDLNVVKIVPKMKKHTKNDVGALYDSGLRLENHWIRREKPTTNATMWRDIIVASLTRCQILAQ